MAGPSKEKFESHTGGSSFQSGQGGQHGQGGSSSIGTQAAGVAQQAKEAGTDLLEKGKDMASQAAHKAGDAATYVGRKAEDATSAVGSSMKNLAGTIRESTPHQGMMGSASSAVADTLESGGRYLQEHGLSGVGDDLTNMIRRNPIPALLVGIGIGFLLARASRS